MTVNTEAGLNVRGEVLVLTGQPVTGESAGPRLPALPGPALAVAVHDESLGTGLFLGRPAHIGMHPVLQVTVAVVSRLGTGTRFGLSAEVGKLGWVTDGWERRVEWADRSLTISARSSRWLAVPAAVRIQLARQGPDGPVLVPVWVAGLVRPASAVVVVGDEPPAHHRGVLLSGVHFAVRPARSPGSRFAPMRSNGISAEPAARTGQAGLVRQTVPVARRPDPAYRSSSS